MCPIGGYAVRFGSAVNNFGVQEMLDTFIDIAPNPKPRETSSREVAPDESKFTGFIFKIHANIDPKHRDRIAFLRVCSGSFKRNTFYQHTRLTKKLKFANPATFLAQEKASWTKPGLATSWAFTTRATSKLATP